MDLWEAQELLEYHHYYDHYCYWLENLISTFLKVYNDRYLFVFGFEELT